MNNKKLSGVVIAMPTPLKENEDVDVASLRKLVDHCIHEGANGIMIAGTMGEGTALMDAQKWALIENTVSHNAGRIPILATVSAVSTRQAVEYASMADSIGVDYVVSTTPFYYKFPDPESLILHTEKIAENIDIPLIFYNAAGCTGNPVTADICDAILNLDNVAGIKDSGCNYNVVVELLRRYPNKDARPGFIMQGDESVFDSTLLMGADGIISGGGVCYIKMLVELYNTAVSGDKLKSIELQRKFMKNLLDLLGPNLGRDWVFSIKRKLVEMNVISQPHVTSPFLTN